MRYVSALWMSQDDVLTWSRRASTLLITIVTVRELPRGSVHLSHTVVHPNSTRPNCDGHSPFLIANASFLSWTVDRSSTYDVRIRFLWCTPPIACTSVVLHWRLMDLKYAVHWLDLGYVFEGILWNGRERKGGGEKKGKEGERGEREGTRKERAYALRSRSRTSTQTRSTKPKDSRAFVLYGGS